MLSVTPEPVLYDESKFLQCLPAENKKNMALCSDVRYQYWWVPLILLKTVGRASASKHYICTEPSRVLLMRMLI